ncbi:DUF3796 domain-containing protein [Streptococcus cristatus]|uniref:DUF3796 domain-containing protein n=1 Tax=Streptococcus cristatus TaxID=45634 RepID=UPI001652F088|nr:DUF3796 domain-containing protein [Streptococcus cristatus]MBC6976639.1 DUF3796 domain-containing protein [Streptococcus cristatus]
MKKSQKMGGLILVATALFIDFTVFLAPSNLSWSAKWMIVGLVSIGQLISIWSWFHMKTWPKKMKEIQEKQVYDLTMKFYNLLNLTATSIYTVGIWLWTPSTNPPIIKHIALGSLLAIQFLFLLFFALKKVKERADERFYANLAKAATLMFAVCIAILLVLAGISANIGSITVNVGIFFIMIGVLVLLFGFVFFLFEKRG